MTKMEIVRDILYIVCFVLSVTCAILYCISGNTLCSCIWGFNAGIYLCLSVFYGVELIYDRKNHKVIAHEC